MITLTNVDEF